MDYFEQFDLPRTIFIDKNSLKEKFYSLSRKLHPDRFINSSAEEQAEILQQSANLNKAYKTLSNPMKLLEYFLQINGVMSDTEKYKLPNRFLMEMMELGEELEDAKLSNNQETIDKLKEKIKVIDADLEAEVKNLFELDGNKSFSVEHMDLLKLYYYKKKYLSNLTI